MIKLLSSIQAKFLGLIFKDESEYTQNQNVVLKQSQLAESSIMVAALDPVKINRNQERKMRRCLELATMENAERQVKHAVAGKKKSDNKVVEL